MSSHADDVHALLSLTAAAAAAADGQYRGSAGHMIGACDIAQQVCHGGCQLCLLCLLSMLGGLVGGKVLQAGRQLSKLWVQLFLNAAGLHALQGGAHCQLHQVAQVLLIHGAMLHCHQGIDVAVSAFNTKREYVGTQQDWCSYTTMLQC